MGKALKVAVTGGRGFVGTHIVEVLTAKGHNVRVLDVWQTPSIDILKNDLRPILEDADVVVHAAARADISKNWTLGFGERGYLWDLNTRGTMNVLDATPPKAAFILLSSAAVYGSQVENGIARDEHSAFSESSESPYAASKLAAEALAFAYGKYSGLRVCCARLVSCVGTGYKHGHIADFVSMIGKNGAIWAKDNGEQKKSFVHVRDAAEAIAHMTENNVCGVFNVTSNEMWSWRDTATCMGDVRVIPTAAVSGWVGDPVNLKVSGKQLQNVGWIAKRKVIDGVNEALSSLGWRK